jgi:hypothetical protein
MFPRPNRPDRPAHAWLDAVRNGLDLLVAFATLRDAEGPPEYDENMPGAGMLWPLADVIPPATAAGRRAAERATHRAAAPSDVPAADHPHRWPLRPATRPRRPGAVRPEPQPCLTPIVARRARPTRAPARGARH